MKRLILLDEALASYESAIALNPNLDYVFNDYLHTRMNLCIWDNLASHLDELTSKVNNGEKALNPFIALALIDDPEIQRKAAEIYANKEYPQSHVLPKIERYQKHKKDPHRVFFSRLCRTSCSRSNCRTLRDAR